VTIPNGTDGGSQTVAINVEGVSQIDLTLNGSGAIDDLMYVPGTPAPLPGSLSGRYFMDNNDNNQDDAEMGLAGISVMLLDAAGNATGDVTTTAADGSYSFSGLAAGTYGVKFTDPAGVLAGKQLVTANQGNDATDSDAIGDTTQSVISNITVTAGNNTPDNDAGAEDIPPAPGQIQGTYFCDNNSNNVQDGPDTAVVGAKVDLIDSTGAVVDTTFTDSNGDYVFTNVAAGDYTVQFGDSSIPGKEFVAQDAGDDETIKLDVLANDTDPDGDNLTITQVAGQNISEGQTITVNGVDVMLMGGELQFDGSGSAVLDALDINETQTVSIEYTVSDGNGGTGTASVDLDFKGTANTVASLEASFPTSDIKFQIIDENNPAPQGGEMWTMKLSQTGDARFEGLVIQEAYCVAVFDSVNSGLTGTNIDNAPMNFGTISLLDDASVIGSSITNIKPGVAADEVDNMINWILNQDFGGQGFTDAEIQGAIWGLTDDTAFVAAGGGELADAQLILDQAMAQGGSFVAGAGDVIGLYIDPNAATQAAGHAQPFVVAVNFDDIDCIC